MITWLEAEPALAVDMKYMYGCKKLKTGKKVRQFDRNIARFLIVWQKFSKQLATIML